MTFILVLLLHLHLAYTSLEIYWHRGYAHKMLNFTKPAEHFFRFILFVSGWGNTEHWLKFICAVHRTHHMFTDIPGDPHSRLLMPTIGWVFEKYNQINLTDEQIQKRAKDVPILNDFIQQKVYNKKYLGILLTGLFYYMLFDIYCAIIAMLVMSCFQTLYIFTLGYVCHFIGYRNEENKKESDLSVNLMPLGFFIAGQELHSNHHNYPSNINLARRWFEIDFGYIYIKLLEKTNLIQIRYDNINRHPIK